MGVSTATVSRVMTGRGQVAADTRERVLEAAARLRYTPSAIGRGLRTDRTMTISVLVPDLGNPVFVPFLRGVQHVSQANGYAMLIADSQRSKAVERQALDRLQSQRVDALVVAGTAQDPAYLEKLRGEGLLIADFSGESSVQGSVAALEAPGTTAMCEALAALGHRRIAYVHRGTRLGAAGRRRWQAVQQHCRRLGIVGERLTFKGDSHAESVASALLPLLRDPFPATAVIAATHGLAPVLLSGLAAAGVDLPDQCSFITYGDSDWASAYRPPISVVTADLYAAGRIMTESILHRLAGEMVASLDSLPNATFVHRGSLGPPPVC